MTTNPYRHAHIYPQEIECPACEYAADELFYDDDVSMVDLGGGMVVSLSELMEP